MDFLQTWSISALKQVIVLFAEAIKKELSFSFSKS